MNLLQHTIGAEHFLDPHPIPISIMILDNASSNTNASPFSAHEERIQAALTAPAAEFNFFSDAPLAACPLRNNGDDICESCQ